MNPGILSTPAGTLTVPSTFLVYAFLPAASCSVLQQHLQCVAADVTTQPSGVVNCAAACCTAACFTAVCRPAAGGLAETYEVKHLLGSGSAGDTWLCKDRATGQQQQHCWQQHTGSSIVNSSIQAAAGGGLFSCSPTSGCSITAVLTLFVTP